MTNCNTFICALKNHPFPSKVTISREDTTFWHIISGTRFQTGELVNMNNVHKWLIHVIGTLYTVGNVHSSYCLLGSRQTCCCLALSARTAICLGSNFSCPLALWTFGGWTGPSKFSTDSAENSWMSSLAIGTDCWHIWPNTSPELPSVQPVGLLPQSQPWGHSMWACTCHAGSSRQWNRPQKTHNLHHHQVLKWKLKQ